MISVDPEVKIIEEVLGQPYGVVPEVLENTLENREMMAEEFVREHFKEEYFKYLPVESRKSMIDSLKNGYRSFVHFQISTHTPCYNPQGHRVIIPQNCGLVTKIHELMHGYTHQRSKSYSNARGGLKCFLNELSKEETELSRVPVEVIEKDFIHSAIDEGVSEYISLTCAALYPHLACEEIPQSAQREAFHSLGEEVIWRTDISKRLPISLTRVGHLASIVSNYFNTLRGCNKPHNLDKIKKDTRKRQDLKKIISHSLNIFNYSLGYLYVRFNLRERTSNLGPEIDSIVQNPPQTLDSLFDNLCRNLNFVTTTL